MINLIYCVLTEICYCYIFIINLIERERKMNRIIYRIGLILCLLVIFVFSHSSTGTGDAVLQSASLYNEAILSDFDDFF